MRNDEPPIETPGKEAEEANCRLARGRALTLSLLVLAGVVNFLDRSSLSIAAGSICSEMHLSASAVGALLSAFTLAYGLAQLPLGPVLDRFGSWRIMAAGLGIWSLAQMLCGVTRGVGGFASMRVLLGLGESPFFPASVKLIRERFAAGQRGRAISVVNVSTAVGQAIAPPLLTVLMLNFGWRAMFAILGGAGLCLMMMWLFAGKAVASCEPVLPSQQLSLGRRLDLLRRRPMWGMMIGFGGVNYTSWFYISWLPFYLQHERHMTIANSGWLAALPFVAAAVGMYSSGLVADLRFKRGEELRSIHLSQIIAGMVLSSFCTLLAVRAESLAASLALICSALFCIHFAGTSGWGYVQAASEPEVVATVGALQNFGSFVIASVAPFLTGWLLDRTGHFGVAFALCATVALVCAGSYAFLVKRSDALLG